MDSRKSETAWYDAETKVQNQLRYRGVDSKRQSFASEYDLLTAGGQKIEVKYASFRRLKTDGRMGWQINFHRHGVLNESEVNWYAAILDADSTGLFGKAVLSLILPAPINKTTLQLSPRSLVSRWAGYVNNWSGLLKAEQAAA